MNFFKNKLREIMKEKEVSQLELYRRTGISPGAISNIVNGRQVPYPGWKKKIASALSISEDEIFPEHVQEVHP
ncbi:MAG: hypothetical protein UU63_C0006G0009 [Candidatus Uhrbacteria bacterium GW2011_GWF2_41_430]|nr:MAG: hypothetical protein UU63_C0006G0009 [Candidatus Uhrbacteria bacterium GW2011_GWF2_41_430]